MTIHERIKNYIEEPNDFPELKAIVEERPDLEFEEYSTYTGNRTSISILRINDGMATEVNVRLKFTTLDDPIGKTQKGIVRLDKIPTDELNEKYIKYSFKNEKDRLIRLGKKNITDREVMISLGRGIRTSYGLAGKEGKAKVRKQLEDDVAFKEKIIRRKLQASIDERRELQ